MEQSKAQIRAYGLGLGLDAVGFVTREQLMAQDERYGDYLALGYSCGFEEQDGDKRRDPALSLADCQTVICGLVAYPHEEPLDPSPEAGRFCAASWGEDYHRVMTAKLTALGEFCRQLWPQCHYQVMVDTGSLSDRGCAAAAGLGWIGRNSNLINKTHGSFVYLGELLLDVALDGDGPVADGCGACGLCAAACPLGAIDARRRMVDTQKCLAYRTLDKSILPPEVMDAIGRGGVVYGCDICQSVCPHNKRPWRQFPAELWGTYAARNPDLTALLAMSNKAFQAAYGHLSGAWRGATVIKRNAALILGSRRSEKGKAVLRQMQADAPSDSLKAAIHWALEQYEK